MSIKHTDPMCGTHGILFKFQDKFRQEIRTVTVLASENRPECF